MSDLPESDNHPFPRSANDEGSEASERKLTAYRLRPTDMKIIPSPADRDWMDATREGWANRCLPLRIANEAGWVLLNDCDFEVVWLGKPAVEALQLTFPEGQQSQHAKSLFGYGILTWTVPYLFRTPPGYNLLVRGPANSFKDGAQALEGIVETDWAVATFTMNWKITRPSCKIQFAKGEPIALILPVRRGELESFRPEIRSIQSNPQLMKSYFEWARSRVEFSRSKKEPDKGKPLPWQKDYTLGLAPDGELAREHQVKLDLRPFVEEE